MRRSLQRTVWKRSPRSTHHPHTPHIGRTPTHTSGMQATALKKAHSSAHPRSMQATVLQPHSALLPAGHHQMVLPRPALAPLTRHSPATSHAACRSHVPGFS